MSDEQFEKGIRDLPESFWHCLCGIHVHKGTLICGLIGAISTTLYFLYMCYDTNSWDILPLCIPSVLCYLLLMVGQQREVVGLYWPHLIVNSIMVLGYLTAILLLGIQVNEAYNTVFPPELTPQQREYFRHVGRIFYIKHAIAMILALVMTIGSSYMLKVTYRGFRYVAEVLNPPLPPEVKEQIRDFVRRQHATYKETHTPYDDDTPKVSIAEPPMDSSTPKSQASPQSQNSATVYRI